MASLDDFRTLVETPGPLALEYPDVDWSRCPVSPALAARDALDGKSTFADYVRECREWADAERERVKEPE